MKDYQMIYVKTLRTSAIACCLAAFALPAAADRISVIVNNNLGFDVTQIYIEGANMEEWTGERLNGRTIAKDDRREFGIEENPESCTYIILVRQELPDGTFNDFPSQHQLCSSGDVFLNPPPS